MAVSGASRPQRRLIKASRRLARSKAAQDVKAAAAWATRASAMAAGSSAGSEIQLPSGIARAFGSLGEAGCMWAELTQMPVNLPAKPRGVP
jgi:hypothetical protein